MITHPMLAAKVDNVASIRYPCLTTPKLDGIRCITMSSIAYSRNFKPIRNRYIQETLSAYPEGCDGELMLRDRSATFQDIASAVMSADGKPDFVYCIFDFIGNGWINRPYVERVNTLSSLYSTHSIGVEPWFVEDIDQLLVLEERCLTKGYEGICGRSLSSPYKQGRSSLREGYLWKLKRFVDSEAVVLAVEEGKHNYNTPTVNELGYTQRKGGQRGHAPSGTFGGFEARDIANGITFHVGNGRGITAAVRDLFWQQRHSLVGRIFTYRYQSVGVKALPRFPQFVGWRDE